VPQSSAAANSTFDIYEDPTLTHGSIASLGVLNASRHDGSFLLQSTPFMNTGDRAQSSFAPTSGFSTASTKTSQLHAPLTFSTASAQPVSQTEFARPTALQPILEVSREDRSNTTVTSASSSSFSSAVPAVRANIQSLERSANFTGFEFPLSLSVKMQQLGQLTQSFASIPGCSVQMRSSSPAVIAGSTFELMGQPTIAVKSLLSHGSSGASTYWATSESGELPDFALTVSPTACPWEFYIVRQAQDRIRKLPITLSRASKSIENALFVNLFKDGCLTGLDWSVEPSLHTVCEMNRKQSKSMVCFLHHWSCLVISSLVRMKL
jgi:hypothetical protein